MARLAPKQHQRYHPQQPPWPAIGRGLHRVRPSAASLTVTPVVLDLSLLSTRDNWASTNKKGTDPNKLFAVGLGSAEFWAIATEFSKTLPQLEIDTIERVENGYQHEMFTVFAKGVEQAVGAQYDARTMRRLLFHGTDAVDLIVNAPTAGFLPLLAGSTTGALYGDGTYFARDAQYSHNYARRLATGQRQMLVAEVAIGRSCVGSQGDKQCPMVPGEHYVRYDSLVDQIASPSIFVVQHSPQAYPAYVITYH